MRVEEQFVSTGYTVTVLLRAYIDEDLTAIVCRQRARDLIHERRADVLARVTFQTSISYDVMIWSHGYMRAEHYHDETVAEARARVRGGDRDWERQDGSRGRFERGEDAREQRDESPGWYDRGDRRDESRGRYDSGDRRNDSRGRYEQGGFGGDRRNDPRGRNERGGYGVSSEPYPKSPDPKADRSSISRGADDRASTPRNSCVYCRGEDHIKRDCPDLKRTIEEGLVVLDDRKYVKWADDLGDVSMFPSMKENVEARRIKTSKGMEPVRSQSIKITFEGDMATTPIRVAATKSARGSTSKKTDTDYVMAEKDGQRVDGEEVILSPRKRGGNKFLMKSSLDEIDTVELLRRALRQPMQCSILEYLAASKAARDELQMITRKTRIPLSEEGHAPKAEASTVTVTGVTARADRMATVLLDGMEGVPPDKFYILGSGAVETIINEEAVLDVVIDNGSEAVIIDEDLAVQVGLSLDRSYLFEIETADGRKQQITGVCHKVPAVARRDLEGCLNSGARTKLGPHIRMEEVLEWKEAVEGLVCVPIDHNPGDTLVCCPVMYEIGLKKLFLANDGFEVMEDNETSIIGRTEDAYEEKGLTALAKWDVKDRRLVHGIRLIDDVTIFLKFKKGDLIVPAQNVPLVTMPAVGNNVVGHGGYGYGYGRGLRPRVETLEATVASLKAEKDAEAAREQAKKQEEERLKKEQEEEKLGLQEKKEREEFYSQIHSQIGRLKLKERVEHQEHEIELLKEWRLRELNSRRLVEQEVDRLREKMARMDVEKWTPTASNLKARLDRVAAGTSDKGKRPLTPAAQAVAANDRDAFLMETKKVLRPMKKDEITVLCAKEGVTYTTLDKTKEEIAIKRVDAAIDKIQVGAVKTGGVVIHDVTDDAGPGKIVANGGRDGFGGGAITSSGIMIATLEEGCKQLQTMVGVLMLRQREGVEINGGAISMDQWLEDMTLEMLNIMWELEEGPDPRLDLYIVTSTGGGRMIGWVLAKPSLHRGAIYTISWRIDSEVVRWVRWVTRVTWMTGWRVVWRAKMIAATTPTIPITSITAASRIVTNLRATVKMGATTTTPTMITVAITQTTTTTGENINNNINNNNNNNNNNTNDNTNINDNDDGSDDYGNNGVDSGVCADAIIFDMMGEMPQADVGEIGVGTEKRFAISPLLNDSDYDNNNNNNNNNEDDDDGDDDQGSNEVGSSICASEIIISAMIVMLQADVVGYGVDTEKWSTAFPPSNLDTKFLLVVWQRIGVGQLVVIDVARSAIPIINEGLIVPLVGFRD
ncbi:hypothetical protein CBR_g45758 [Chara braunii]|uniref:CCHC-type domain-containing protein n=1 Tax=Chara braunii TaxID=69332 RepID=A0A388LZ77_CHABU|nr:hypothetical protein CBR_g45758 [Chara braunii]|eukprot:GBG87606.1 hypothetical protein CBR_g45758 [Chara braunii]